MRWTSLSVLAADTWSSSQALQPRRANLRLLSNRLDLSHRAGAKWKRRDAGAGPGPPVEKREDRDRAVRKEVVAVACG